MEASGGTQISDRPVWLQSFVGIFREKRIIGYLNILYAFLICVLLLVILSSGQVSLHDRMIAAIMKHFGRRLETISFTFMHNRH